MQYSLKITTMKGEDQKGNPSKPLDKFMTNLSFDSEPTVKQLKDSAMSSMQLKDYKPEEILGGVLIVKGEEAKDDNVTVPVHTFINYILTLK
jgi:hypothetical protein